MADTGFLQRELELTLEALVSVRRAIDVNEQSGLDTSALRQTERQYQELVLSLQRQLQAASADPVESAGQTVAEAQRANDQGADTLAPGPEIGDVTPESSVITNADRFQTNVTTGTDDELRTPAVTQSLPPITAQPGPARRDIAGPNSPGQQVEPPNAVDPRSVDDNLWPTSQAGAGSPTDDAAGNNNPTRAALNKLFTGRIQPEPNVLDQYASYTYSISIYLMNRNDYAALIQNPNALPKGAQLILQSAGAPVAGGSLPTVDIQETQQAADGNGAPLNVPELGRNPNFPLDYYIDDLRLISYINGKATGISHNVFEMQFKITEPNGITFLDNLYKATDQYIKLSGQPQVNYAAQNYLMAIRFYGYDKSGNLVLAKNQPFTDPLTNSTVQTVVEKFIPFQFRGIKFRVANRVIEYDCDCVAVSNSIATSPARGSIQYNVELRSQSLKDLLQGQQAFAQTGASSGAASDAFRQGPDQSSAETARLQRQNAQGARSGATQSNVSSANFAQRQAAASERVRAARREQLGLSPNDTTAPPPPVTAGGESQTSAPPKASAAVSKTLVTGLVDALNRQQDDWVKKGTIEFADRYFIELDPVLADAKVVPPGQTNLRNTPMGPNENARDKLLERTQAVDNNARKFSILSGTSIVQFLDQVLRNSSYIYDQQTKYYDPKTNELKLNGKPANVMGWYRIGLQAVPQADKYDRKRNDYAYDITYRVEVYGINDAKSDFFPSAQFRGVHKQYNYWFTGLNTQVLDFQQDFNYLYYIVQNARSPVRTRTTNHREVTRYVGQPRSDQTDQMNEGTVSEASAGLADYLYSPRDTSEVKLRIIGDPAWIQQGDVRGGLPRGRFLYDAFLPDGTINYAGQEVLFEVLWNKPADYDLSTGLLDPGTRNFKSNRAGGQAGDAAQTYVFRAKKCTSYFSKGRFEQEIEGNQVMFTLPQDTQAAQDKNQRANDAKNNATDYRNPSVDIPQASPGLLDLELGSGGEVNYKPTSLATVLDQQSSAKSIFTPQTPRGASPARPATSSTETVGIPNESSAETNRLLGTARGPGVGVPSTTLTLRDGQTVQINSTQDLMNYGGVASANERLAAARRLNLAQQAANTPVSSRARQVIAKDN